MKTTLTLFILYFSVEPTNEHGSLSKQTHALSPDTFGTPPSVAVNKMHNQHRNKKSISIIPPLNHMQGNTCNKQPRQPRHNTNPMYKNKTNNLHAKCKT